MGRGGVGWGRSVRRRICRVFELREAGTIAHVLSAREAVVVDRASGSVENFDVDHTFLVEGHAHLVRIDRPLFENGLQERDLVQGRPKNGVFWRFVSVPWIHLHRFETVRVLLKLEPEPRDQFQIFGPDDDVIRGFSVFICHVSIRPFVL